jgi:hypothetical protein
MKEHRIILGIIVSVTLAASFAGYLRLECYNRRQV